MTDARWAVVNKLIDMDQNGCDVRVAGGLDENVADWLAAYGVSVCVQSSRVHSKYIMVNGTLHGVGDRKKAWTGSHNLTGPALGRHSENFIQIDNETVSDKYAHNFNVVTSSGGTPHVCEPH